ncbi:MAG: CPBP family glutamic-type intramembrane protease [Ktedonobacteraceae bacterium]
MIEQKPDTTNQTQTTEMPGQHLHWVPWTAQQTFYAVLLTLIPWIAFSLLLNALGGNTTSNQLLTTAQDLTGAIVALIFTALVEGAFLIAPIYYVKRIVHDAKKALPANIRALCQALGLRRFHVARTLLWVIGLMVLVFAFDELYSYVITALQLHIMTNDQVVLQQSKVAPLTTYAVLLGSIIIAPICEELFFRGFVLPGLLHEMAPTWAVLVSAALFAIAHADLSSFLPLFVIGIALGILRLRSGSTWAGISLHMLNNTLASVLIILAMHNIVLPF